MSIAMLTFKNKFSLNENKKQIQTNLTHEKVDENGKMRHNAKA